MRCARVCSGVRPRPPWPALGLAWLARCSRPVATLRSIPVWLPAHLPEAQRGDHQHGHAPDGAGGHLQADQPVRARLLRPGHDGRRGRPGPPWHGAPWLRSAQRASGHAAPHRGRGGSCGRFGWSAQHGAPVSRRCWSACPALTACAVRRAMRTPVATATACIPPRASAPSLPAAPTVRTTLAATTALASPCRTRACPPPPRLRLRPPSRRRRLPKRAADAAASTRGPRRAEQGEEGWRACTCVCVSPLRLHWQCALSRPERLFEASRRGGTEFVREMKHVSPTRPPQANPPRQFSVAGHVAQSAPFGKQRNRGTHTHTEPAHPNLHPLAPRANPRVMDQINALFNNRGRFDLNAMMKMNDMCVAHAAWARVPRACPHATKTSRSALRAPRPTPSPPRRAALPLCSSTW